MARERMVTRTIESTLVQYLGLNISTRETIEDVTEIAGIVPDNKLLDVVKKDCETDTFKVVTITGTEKRERLFGMREQEFFENAIELDPITRKPIDF